MARIAALALALLPPLLSACIIDGVVLPEGRTGDNETPDTPPPGGAYSLRSELIFYSGSNPVLVAGAPGATPGIGSVVVRNDRRNAAASARTQPDGSFNLPITADAGETLTLTFAWDGSDSTQSASLDLTPPSAMASDATAQLSENFATDLPSSGGEEPAARVQAPDNGGVVTVIGSPGLVDPNVGVVVANVSNGATGYSRASAEGGFVVRVAASSNDELHVFTVQPDVSNGGGVAFVLTAP